MSYKEVYELKFSFNDNLRVQCPFKPDKNLVYSHLETFYPLKVHYPLSGQTTEFNKVTSFNKTMIRINDLQSLVDQKGIFTCSNRVEISGLLESFRAACSY